MVHLRKKVTREKESIPETVREKRILPPEEFAERIELILKNKKDCIENLVGFLVDQAVMRSASDIHLEPHRTAVSVKYRIDGILQQITELPTRLKEGILIRIKVMSNLIVYKRDIPQDGSLKMSGLPVEIRVTTFPTVYGEKAVLRIFDSRTLRFRLEELGFSADTGRNLEELISKPFGIILLTGPANSGKTTTIYAAIQKILEMKPGCNVVTLEDPIEYEFGNISQTQINPSSPLTYSRALSSVMRQDPEVIVLGEIRDSETANIVMEAGLTGHLILSTIHSGTAASVFIRLLEMNIEPFLLVSAISGVIAQRLVRKICRNCKEEYQPPEDLLNELGITRFDGPFYHGRGCELCLKQGYSGRTVLSEIVVLDDRLRETILSRPSISRIRQVLKERKSRTLLEDGIVKIKNGITTPEEIKRVL